MEQDERGTMVKGKKGREGKHDEELHVDMIIFVGN